MSNRSLKGYTYPKNKENYLSQLAMCAEQNYADGIMRGKEIAKNEQTFEVTAAKIQIMKEAAALAQANAKLTYALSQIVGEKKGFGQ
jgi:hypothetical protein